MTDRDRGRETKTDREAESILQGKEMWRGPVLKAPLGIEWLRVRILVSAAAFPHLSLSLSLSPLSLDGVVFIPAILDPSRS